MLSGNGVLLIGANGVRLEQQRSAALENAWTEDGYNKFSFCLLLFLPLFLLALTLALTSGRGLPARSALSLCVCSRSDDAA